jgi:hypothetical protein
MNAKLKLLWDDAITRLQAVADDLEARGAVPMPDNFPLLGSFAHDDPEAHALAGGAVHLDATGWSDKNPS